MFGSTTLREIRETLERARRRGLSPDPEIADAKRAEGAKIIEELNQFLQRARKELHGRSRARAKKRFKKAFFGMK
jgi:hypothetical protein